ncbi:16S rRNA (uracil(1498)-N(3))-methyltransferase [Flavobacterium orientale]|uniref:Ribosomal RNA small subunit methyltransferase E n=1 Tax=Flavobacterium orientale TaxID=1756020 RepID=A0A917DET6_9FLAO|nr:16S rRNA (uracil(1498)-N(3))-methyltransferase [Flavobacterium orientale]GGD31115.1 ribosomal RNA small subunit methyltransferase E [Flavobacterium orientale]
MQLFYFPSLTEQTKSFSFSKEESKHIVKVLRKKENDNLFVTNGLGYLFSTKIAIASESKCTVDILSFEKQESSKVHLHLAVAPTKMNERYEWFLEKVTEIGIQEITPLICDHSERKIVKTERFEKILLSAMKQSNQYFLPKLNHPISFKEFIKQNISGQKFIAHCYESEKTTFKSSFNLNEAVLLLIGPEGDFSIEEVALAEANNFKPVSLGTTRLRTETAAIIGCHTVAVMQSN